MQLLPFSAVSPLPDPSFLHAGMLTDLWVASDNVLSASAVPQSVGRTFAARL